MIIKKEMTFNTKCIDETILEIAEEIKKGYSVLSLGLPETTKSCSKEYWPEYRILLINKGYTE